MSTKLASFHCVHCFVYSVGTLMQTKKEIEKKAREREKINREVTKEQRDKIEKAKNGGKREKKRIQTERTKSEQDKPRFEVFVLR
jgi:hypothetical protein